MKKVITLSPVLSFLFILFLIPLSAEAQNPDLYISSRTDHAVKRYDGNTGQFKGNFVPSGRGGLSRPQEVLFHPDGSLLVTGRDNPSILRYDGQTGAFLGNFTSGYTLDNPTKTVVGPDSLLYVAQWGSFQNKVVRFNFQTGQFVDEFTSVGVPQGCGIDWDSTGNLYVARWGNGTNGNVYKFDTLGKFVSIFIPSGRITGPTNIWFGDDGNLLVADWSQGEVFRFDGKTGDYMHKVITGMTNVEGFVYDADGLLYLCDWGANVVNRYNLAHSTTMTFINIGTLQNPNSITFGPSPSTAIDKIEDFEALNVTVAPNPFSHRTQFSFDLHTPEIVKLVIFDLQGQEIEQVWSEQMGAGSQAIPWEPEAVAAGVYFYRMEVNDQVKMGKVVIR